MKFTAVSKGLILSLALLLASSAFAATKTSLQLSGPVSVNGTTLKAGSYKVKWEGSGPDVEVSFLQGRNIVAKAPAHVVELQRPAPQDETVVRTNSDGPGSLTGLRFQGKKISLELAEGGGGVQGGSSR
ncbi:MAG: hypothetical protein WAM69_10850 [Candidatus Sulfotelmatobacter sp.]